MGIASLHYQVQSGFALPHPTKVRRRALSLYATRGLSCRNAAALLATELGVSVSPQTVARWARKAGKSRPVGGARLPLSGAELKPLYEAGATASQLARRFHVSRTLISERLHEAGTNMRQGWTKYPSLTEDALRRMYWTEGRSSKEIATRVGCSQMTVHYRLRLYDIPRKRKRTRV